jgi:hypothetical protein
MRNNLFLIKWKAPHVVSTLLAALVLLACASATQAQVGRFNAARKRDKFEIEGLLRSQESIPLRQVEKFDAFFNEFVFPYYLSPKFADRLPQLRDQLRRYFLIGKSGEPYDRLNKLTRDFVQQILRTSKDPALLYNAVLMLGELNEFEASGTKLMKPLPAALPELIKLLNDPGQPDYIRVAALVGALRHASLSDTYPLAAEPKAALAKTALAMLKQAQVPKSRTPAGHAYVRRNAADLLGYLGDLGKDNENLNAVLAVLNDPRASLSMRLGMLPVLGMFRYGNNAKVDFASLLSTVGHTAVEAAERELVRAATISEERQIEPKPDRRRLSYYFRQAQWALDGPPTARRGGIVAGANGGPAAPIVKTFRTKVFRVLADLDKADNVDPIEFEGVIADFQTALPARAKAARVPADAAGESNDSGND